MMISLSCPECENPFEKERWYFKKLEKLGRKAFCSRSCSTKFSNKRRNAKRTFVCAGCEKEIVVNMSSQKDKYCSKPCYFDHQKDRLAERARRVGKDSAQKISETKKAMFASGELVHPRLGVKLEDETKEKLSKSRKKYYETHDGYWKGKKLPERVSEKISETRTKNWIDGKYDHIKMAWAKGHYFFEKAGRKVYYRSSWELAFMKYLDAKSDVVKCRYESLKIPYFIEGGCLRYYIPDILVEYTDGRKVLYEVKPFSRKDSEINKRKFKAARKHCQENNMKFKVVTERYLKHVRAL